MQNNNKNGKKTYTFDEAIDIDQRKYFKILVTTDDFGIIKH